MVLLSRLHLEILPSLLYIQVQRQFIGTIQRQELVLLHRKQHLSPALIGLVDMYRAKMVIVVSSQYLMKMVL